MRNRIPLIIGVTAILVAALFVSLSVYTPVADANSPDNTMPEVSVVQADFAAQITDGSQDCMDCHAEETPKMVQIWEASKHNPANADDGEGATCLSCHAAEEGDFDAFEHEGYLTAIHPTPKDCAQCHEDEVTEFGRSKHAATSMIFLGNSFDRKVFEPTIATKHGCQECHNIGHMWPDQSVGECDACHPKHSFDVAVARNPYTCGECHIGPDHPHIEIYLESKHGNIFTTRMHEWDLGYDSDDNDGLIPIPVPTCTTCHMDAAPGMPSTHDVGTRLAWETQSPYTIRTTEAWGDGLTWQEKRDNMETVCRQCHAQPFIERYLLVGDLNALQYNEIFREGKRWLNMMNDAGAVPTAGFEGLAPFTVAGYDQDVEEDAYHIWHHEGRRYRHGALMMGADYTQWHGIWDLQHDLVHIIQAAAEAGLPEAEAWVNSPDPNKFWLYPTYDVPGTAWGPDILAFRKAEDYTAKILMNRGEDTVLDDYWERAQANVEAVYNHGLLSDKQWDMAQDMFENRDYWAGVGVELPVDYTIHSAGLKLDGEATTEQVGDLELPGKAYWQFEE